MSFRINPVYAIIGFLLGVAVIAESALLASLLSEDYTAARGGADITWLTLSFGMVDMLIVTTVIAAAGALLTGAFTQKYSLTIGIGLLITLMSVILDAGMYPFQADLLPLALPVAIGLSLTRWAAIRIAEGIGFARDGRVLKSPAPASAEHSRDEVHQHE